MSGHKNSRLPAYHGFCRRQPFPNTPEEFERQLRLRRKELERKLGVKILFEEKDGETFVTITKNPQHAD